MYLFRLVIEHSRPRPTPRTSHSPLRAGNSLMNAIASVCRSVYERIPSKDIRLVCSSVPTVYLHRLVDFVATQVDSTPHIQLHLMWARWMLMSHGNWLSEKRSVVASSLKGLHKALSKQFSDIGGLANNNLHTVTFLSTTRGEEDEDNGPELGLVEV